MQEKVVQVLKEIGLGKVEIDTYLDLLRSKVSTAAEVAKRTRQHRSNVYDALKRLQQMGFITERVEQNKRYFESKLPEVIFSYLKQKESEVKRIIPYLEEISNKKIESESASASYGLSRLRAIMYDLVECDDEILFWGVPNDAYGFLEDAFLKGILLKNRAKKRRPTRILFNGRFEHMEDLNKIKNQRVKWLPKQDYRSMVMICGDALFLVIFNTPVMIIEMHGKMASKWYTAQFENLWDIARPPISKSLNVVKKATTFKKKAQKNLKKLLSDIKLK